MLLHNNAFALNQFVKWPCSKWERLVCSGLNVMIEPSFLKREKHGWCVCFSPQGVALVFILRWITLSVPSRNATGFSSLLNANHEFVLKTISYVICMNETERQNFLILPVRKSAVETNTAQLPRGVIFSVGVTWLNAPPAWRCMSTHAIMYVMFRTLTCI